MKPGRKLVIGDIHGAYKALVQCFEKGSFDIQNDLLICLGDLCDRWPEVDKVFEILLKIKNLVLLLGNHDSWALEWFTKRKTPDVWVEQGGDVTMNAYRHGVPESHIKLLQQAELFHLQDNRLFVHAGYDLHKDIYMQERNVLLWDRSLIKTALNHKYDMKEIKLTAFEEVYVGHTPTLNFGATTPIKACEVYMMDTGAGWPGGVLTMMDIDSKEFYQSDIVNSLY